MNALGQLFVKIGADLRDFKSGMKEMSTELQQRQNEVDEISRKFAMAAGAMGAAILAFGAVATKNFADVGDQLDKMSKRTGLSVEVLSKLRFVAERSGTSVAGVETGIRRLQRAISDASEGMKTYTRAFSRLGLDYEQLARLSPEDQFMAVMRALAGVSDASLRAALAQEILGRAGTQLLPMISDGTARFEELMQTASDLGVTMDQETAAKAAKLKDAMTDLKGSAGGLMRVIGEGLAPIIKDLAEKVTKATAAFSRWADEHPVLSSTISQLAMAVGGLGVAFAAFVLIGPKVVMAMKAIGLAAHAMLGPLGLVTLALAAVVTGLTYLVNKARAANEEQKRLATEGLQASIDSLNELSIAAQAAYDDEIERLRKTYGIMADETKLFYRTKMDEAQEAHDAVLQMMDEEKDAFQRLWDFKTRQADEAYRAELRQINDLLDATIRANQEKLRALNMLDRADDMQRLEGQKAQLEAALEVVQSDEKRAQLLEELARVQQDITRAQRYDERARLQDAIADAQTEATAKRQAAEAQYEAEIALINQKVLEFINGTEAEKAAIVAVWTEATSGMVDYQAAFSSYYTDRLKVLDVELEDNLARIATERQAYEEAEAAKLRATLERITTISALASAVKRDIEEGTNTLAEVIAGLSPELQERYAPEIASFAQEREAGIDLSRDPLWEAIKNVYRLTPAGGLHTAWDLLRGNKTLADLKPEWIPMQHGGAGVARKPTLFLAGEAGEEPWAFGSKAIKAAAAGMSPQPIDSGPVMAVAASSVPMKNETFIIDGGLFLGDRSDAARWVQMVLPEIRRQQRLSTGGAEW